MRPRHLLLSVLLVVAVFTLYWRTKDYAFVSVDVADYLTENPFMQRGLTWSGVVWAWTQHHASNWHPLTWMSHMLDVSLFGFVPAGHNLENVAWHAANSVLVYFLFLRLTGFAGRSAFIAFCFALHPLHVESVAWIAERKDVLAAFFGLASLLAWIGYARDGRRGAYGAAWVLFFLGLCAKPMLVTWPFVLALFDFWPFARLRLGWRKLVVEKLPFLALTAGSIWLTWWAQSSERAMQPLELMPLPWRFANAVLAYGSYLAKACVPIHLAVYYPHPGPTIDLTAVAIAGVALASALVAAILLVRRAPWFFVGFCFYLGTLVPVIGIVQVGGQAMADRYTYLPLLGFFLIVSYAVTEAAERAPMARGLLKPIAVLSVIGLFALSWRQVATWKDSMALGQNELAVTGENAWAYNLIGRQLLEEERYAEAAKTMETALSRLPGDPQTWHLYGKALAHSGDTEGAARALRRALELRPDDPSVLNHLAEVLLATGNVQEARPMLEHALDLDPRYAGSHNNQGRLLQFSGDLAGAEREFRTAVELLPAFDPARMNLAKLLLRRGDAVGALRQLDAVLVRLPKDLDARRGRGRALQMLGRDEEAREQYEAVVAEQPQYPPGLGDLAWCLLSARDERLRDAPRAVALAEKAVANAPNGAPALLDVLALAYASTGKFELAIPAATTAAARARELGDEDLARRIEGRLAAYREQRVDLSIPR